VKKSEVLKINSYPVDSQIWLDCIMDDRQFSYITNTKKKSSNSSGLTPTPTLVRTSAGFSKKTLSTFSLKQVLK